MTKPRKNVVRSVNPGSTRKRMAALPANGVGSVASTGLLVEVRQLIEGARRSAAMVVHAGLTVMYWRRGQRIRAEVLGDQRADYGQQIAATLSRQSSGSHFLVLLPLKPYNRDTHIPKGYDWASLRSQDGRAAGGALPGHPAPLGQEPGMLGAIFFKAQNKIQDPAKLSRLVQMIDAESWISLDADTKGDLYEGLLQKNAEDTKSGAGQYFTPRALIEAMVACVRPEPMKTIADPACGTGGFFLGAYDWLTRPDGSTTLDKRQKEFLRDKTFHGNEIVPSTRRLCLMNLFLHNIGELDGEPSVERSDALIAEPKRKVDYVLANPPFGKKSSMTITNEEGEEDKEALTYERQDFWETTSNKQLNFLQHIVSMLKVDGKAAVVLPDNVLFEGGAGEKIRRKLLETCDVHTVLRLPTGIFYAQGVKANVLFFDARPKDGRDAHQGRVVLRPAHQQALHAEDAAAEARRPAGFHRLLPPGKPPRAQGDRALQVSTATTT